MSETKTKTKNKVKAKPQSDLADQLYKVPSEADSSNIQTVGVENIVPTDKDKEEEKEIQAENNAIYNRLFDGWDEAEFEPQDFMVDVPIESIESAVGYSSLFRQFHQAFISRVAFYRSEIGGSLPVEEARAKAFHACSTKEEAKKQFYTLMRLPLENIDFIDLEELHQAAPRVAERFWERAKREGQKEFISGHLGANITFPVGYMKQLWNIARYLGVRESFIADWKPRGGIEVALIDMMTQSYFQWQYWLEQTVRRSETRERETHPDYARFLSERERKFKANGWTDGFWNRPYVTEQQAIEHAVQMADRFNRIFMRTLRQLRDLRRYSPVTINNPNQVNIAADGGQQVNVSNTDEDNTKKINY